MHCEPQEHLFVWSPMLLLSMDKKLWLSQLKLLLY